MVHDYSHLRMIPTWFPLGPLLGFHLARWIPGEARGVPGESSVFGVVSLLFGFV